MSHACGGCGSRTHLADLALTSKPRSRIDASSSLRTCDCGCEATADMAWSGDSAPCVPPGTLLAASASMKLCSLVVRKASSSFLAFIPRQYCVYGTTFFSPKFCNTARNLGTMKQHTRGLRQARHSAEQKHAFVWMAEQSGGNTPSIRYSPCIHVQIPRYRNT